MNAHNDYATNAFLQSIGYEVTAKPWTYNKHEPDLKRMFEQKQQRAVKGLHKPGTRYQRQELHDMCESNANTTEAQNVLYSDFSKKYHSGARESCIRRF